jgi:hypothetical protein
MTQSRSLTRGIAVWLVAFGASSCANRGMRAPDEDPLDAGWPANSRPGTTGDAGGPTSGEAGDPAPAAGGAGGRASPAGTGGAGSGAAGAPGTGGVTPTGGSPGTGGVTGAGGVPAGTGGASGTGGLSAGTGGAGGTAGAAGHVCAAGGQLDCSSAGALQPANGEITDFSPLDWNGGTGQFCGAGGVRGRLFSFGGPGSSTGAASVDAAAQNLDLKVTVTSWAGGGVIFESCVNAAAFTSVQFTATLVSGSLSGCTWQVQLQTQDQRASTDTDPSGGTCTSNCYAYPAAGLAAPGAGGTTYTKAFTQFNDPSASQIPMETQVVGVQWQVTAASSQGCSAELRIDDVSFR